AGEVEPAPILAADDLARPRAELTDRNGQLLAVNLPVVSLDVDGRKVWDPDETAAALAGLLPKVDGSELAEKLKARRYVTVAKELSPEKRAEVFALGLPGVLFQPHEKRLYPRGDAGAHVLGHVDADGVGVMGMERWLDEAAPTAASVALSIDLRAQQALEEELERGVAEFEAIAGWGVALDVDTGEVLALASNPTFDPNQYGRAEADARRNRATFDRYELGSAFKAITVALALESKTASLKDVYDARKPLRISGHTIRDFHPENRPLSVAEVFMYSSNIGSAKMALEAGVERHRALIGSLGLLDRLAMELPERGRPLSPE
ncbi:MAG: penicillin-binding transpeptidase domain-containing protein, partial [Pseudomonadota bacterium]